ncbi:MAG: chemotaxis protein CheA [Nitrospirota bacterium]|nr:chemotaxis protein CheA [Nitrospirota bacterium]
MRPDIPEDMAEIFDEFLVETTESLVDLDQHFLALESNPGDTGLLNQIFRTVHSIKGGAGFLGLNDLVSVAHGSENILNKLRNGELGVTPEIIDIVLQSVDVIKAILAQCRGEDVGQMDIPNIVQKLELMLQFAEEMGSHAATAATTALQDAPQGETQGETQGDIQDKNRDDAQSAPPAHPRSPASAAPPDDDFAAALVETPAAPAPAPAAPAATAVSTEEIAATAAPATAPRMEMETTIRVDTSRLDNVMNLVGELVLCRNRTLKLVSELDTRYENDPALRALVTTAGQMNLVTTDLQLSVMKTRMQPVGKIFQKFPRMVRDISRKLGKQIDLVISGEETELDKSMLEELGDPLVHLVRNSVDHGIETAEEREQSGKPALGIIQLSAEHDGASILIRIQDDGAGINHTRIRAKVIEKGLMPADQVTAMSDREALNLIFLPGLSTKDQISDLSGRGVGMDVVLSNIRKVGGIIDVESEPGKGTSITLSLPLTIAIIPTLMVQVDTRLFAIPLSSIVETLRVGRDEIQMVDGRPVIRLRDRILPVTPLGDLFGVDNSRIAYAGMEFAGAEHTGAQVAAVNPDPDRLNIVVVALAEKKIGLVVDDLQQQEEVVIKSLGDYLGSVPGISGATINGEGQVVLILDVGTVIDLMH